MIKQDAIKKLKKKIYELTKLPDYIYNGDNFEFSNWKVNTEKTIFHIFDDAEYTTKFKNIIYHPETISLISDNSSLSVATYILGVKKAKILLESYLEEINEFWEPDTTREHKIKNIFISHITEEKEVALVLKDWIESTFTGQFSVFVSNDNEDIPVGSKWLTQINNALNESIVFIVLCSQSSMPRPWINFEIGCAWTKQIPIIPICYNGMTKSSLPSTVSSFQGINLDRKESLEKLFKGIAKHLDVSKTPRISYQDMLNEMNKALEKTVVKKVEIKEEKDNNFIHEIEQKILLTYSYNQTPSELEYIKNIIKESHFKTEFYIDTLVKNNFLSRHYNDQLDYLYSLEYKGKEYLIQNNLV